MFLTSKDGQEFSIPGGTQGVLYPPGPNKAFSIAVVTMDGQYPENGWSLNDKCTETIYVQAGSLVANVDGKQFKLKSGDILSIVPGKKYRVRGKAMTVDVITPAWDKGQNHIITK